MRHSVDFAKRAVQIWTALFAYVLERKSSTFAGTSSFGSRASELQLITDVTHFYHRCAAIVKKLMSHRAGARRKCCEPRSCFPWHRPPGQVCGEAISGVARRLLRTKSKCVLAMTCHYCVTSVNYAAQPHIVFRVLSVDCSQIRVRMTRNIFRRDRSQLTFLFERASRSWT